MSSASLSLWQRERRQKISGKQKKERARNGALGNKSSAIMTKIQEEHVDKTLGIVAGVMFLAVGTVAFLTDLSKVGAIILGILGIGGFILAFRRPQKRDSATYSPPYISLSLSRTEQVGSWHTGQWLVSGPS